MKRSGLSTLPDSNPFCSRFIRAGSIPFFFPRDETMETTRQRLIASKWRGQVVGPHGSGKTTLLRSLAHHWRAWGRDPLHITLREGQRKLPPLRHSWGPSTQLVIDGFEQLGWFRRWVVIWRCRRADCGLLVSTHRTLLPPTILETHTSIGLAHRIVDYLVDPERRPSHADVERTYSEMHGNLRETLFSLYDVCRPPR